MKFGFYAVVMLVMPCVTVLFAHRMVGGYAAFVAFAAAMCCVVLAALLTQTAPLMRTLVGTVRKLSGIDDDTPLGFVEKAFFSMGPISASVFIYAAAGAVLSLWATSHALLGGMLLLGATYGGLIAVGLIAQLSEESG